MLTGEVGSWAFTKTNVALLQSAGSKDSMKRLAYLLVAVGALIAIFAFNMDVTVGDSGIVNMNMMAQRQNLLIVGCVAFLAGIVLVVGVQRQAEPKEEVKPARSDEMTTRSTANFRKNRAAFKENLDALVKHLLKDTTPTEFTVRLLCAITSAAIAAIITYAVWGFAVWIYPAPVIVFWLAMKKGLRIAALIFIAESVACLVIPVIYVALYDGPWSSFGYLAPEFFVCIAGVLLAKKFQIKVASAVL